MNPDPLLGDTISYRRGLDMPEHHGTANGAAGFALYAALAMVAFARTIWGLSKSAACAAPPGPPEDGTAACEVMTRSIAELCVADHRNDPAILGRWLSNKTPETFRSWIRLNNSLLVGIENDDILAVGCVTDGGSRPTTFHRTRDSAA